MTSKKAPPGSDWRILHYSPRGYRKGEVVSLDCTSTSQKENRLSHRSVFDELVISPWLHVEQMDSRGWFVQVCDRAFWVCIGRDGKAKITYEEVR